MVHHRLLVLALVASATTVGVVARTADAQPRRDLGAAAVTVWPKACDASIMKAARWFVRELDAGTITVEAGPGWRAWRGTTMDEGLLLPVLWLKIEAIDPTSKSAGAVSGWIEVEGAPPGMQVSKLDEDTSAAVLPDTHWTRSLGRWRLVRALVDGTPKEQAMVIKAFDRCATALTAPPKKPRRR